MTDRNVRKLIDLMLDNLRRDLYYALKNRHKSDSSSAILEDCFTSMKGDDRDNRERRT